MRKYHTFSLYGTYTYWSFSELCLTAACWSSFQMRYFFMCMNSTFRIGIQIKKKAWNIRINVTSRRVRVTIVAVEKTVRITYPHCMSVDLFIQHAKRRDRIILSSVACLALAYFSTPCYKQPPVSGGKKGVIEHKICFGILYDLSKIFLFIGRIFWDSIIDVYRSSCEVHLILVRY
jgi:hypothetical protein